VTNNPPAAIQTLIDAHINGFNTQDNDLFLSVFGDTAIIIDGIAPYRWLNPNAPANWLADVKKWREGLGVTSEHLSYEMGFWNVDARPHMLLYRGLSLSRLRASPSFGPVPLRTRSRTATTSGGLRRRLGAARLSPVLCAVDDPLVQRLVNVQSRIGSGALRDFPSCVGWSRA